jgi:hypothetical protein
MSLRTLKSLHRTYLTRSADESIKTEKRAEYLQKHKVIDAIILDYIKANRVKPNNPTDANKKRRFATCKHKQDGANLLQTIAQKGGSPEGFYDFANKHGAGLGMQRIQGYIRAARTGE